MDCQAAVDCAMIFQALLKIKPDQSKPLLVATQQTLQKKIENHK